MTQTELKEYIRETVNDDLKANLIIGAVEAYSSASNNGNPLVSCRFSDEDVINVITAWESLQGNRNYRPKDIEDWLRDYMSPAINRLRAVLNGS